MGKKKKYKFCAYCNKYRKPTRDHIPPRSLFPKKDPGELATVPCCEKCRGGWSKDDEYFRLAMVMSCAGNGVHEVDKINQTIIRSLKRPESAGLASLVNRSIKEVEISTPAGILLGKSGTISLERKRIERVSKRIIRGLFYFVRERPLPDTYKISIDLLEHGITPEIAKLLKKDTFPPYTISGKGLFKFTFVRTKEDRDSTLWILKFYDKKFMLGYTSKHLKKKNA